MERLRSNAEYLFSLEAYASPMCRQVVTDATNTADVTCGQWYMRHWSQYLKPVFDITGAPTASFKLQINVNSVWMDAYTGSGITTTTSHSPDINLADAAWAALVKGWTYKVRLLASSATVTVKRIYTYGILPASKGGYDWYTHSANFLNDTLAAASVTAELAGWINNLNYLRDQLAGPWAPIKQTEVGAVGQSGWVQRFDFQHRADYLAWQGGGRWVGSTWSGGQISGSGPQGPSIEVGGVHYPIGVYNGGTTHYSAEVIIPGSGATYDLFSENRYTLVQPTGLGTMTKGNWYTVAFGRRPDSETNSLGVFDVYVAAVAEVGGVPSTSGWTVVPPFVGGETAADVVSLLAGTKFRKFHDNLATLKTRIDNYPHTLCETPHDTQHFFRRGDILAWRGTNVDLLYSTRRIPTNTTPQHKLIRLGDSVSAGGGESLLDLNSITDLPREADYLLRTSPGNTIEYCFELL